MSEPTASRDPDMRALAHALREHERMLPTPDVNEALQQRLQAETRDSRVLYVVVQALLLGALAAGGLWYLLR